MEGVPVCPSSLETALVDAGWPAGRDTLLDLLEWLRATHDINHIDDFRQAQLSDFTDRARWSKQVQEFLAKVLKSEQSFSETQTRQYLGSSQALSYLSSVKPLSHWMTRFALR